MKYLLMTSMIFFSLSAFANDLSFGSFDTETTQIDEKLDDRVLDLLSFEIRDLSERSIANTNEAEDKIVVDPIAFGSFE